MNLNNLACTAAYMALGLDIEAREQPVVLGQWSTYSGSGHFELMLELTQHARHSEAYIERNYKNADYPGVYDYEVSEPFGRWFGQYLLEHGEPPSRTMARIELEARINKFFNQ